MSEPAQHLSLQDAFARHWFPYGYPLWNPKPVLLPEARQTEGIKIGDVGIIDRDGCFDALFNICLPRDRALEDRYEFPPDFTEIAQPRITHYHSFPPGHVLSSPQTPWSSRSKDMPYFTSESTMVSDRVGTQHTANLFEDGAHIVVPRGAHCSKLVLQCYRLFESQANDHWSTWFNFATARLGPLESIYLVTGLCRTCSWALASFKKDGRPVEVTCELVEQDRKLRVDDSRWTPSGRFDSKIGPSMSNQEQDNQTIFIQSFTITPNGTIRHPNQEQLASANHLNVTKRGESSKRASSRAGSASSMVHRWFRRGLAASGVTLTGANSATIQHVPAAMLPAHPSQIINQYLLTKQPSADAAVTHDSTWITMLSRGQLPKLEDLESGIDAIVSQHYAIVVSDGIVCLRDKNVALARFGFRRSDLPADLADCIQQDGETPPARSPFGSTYSGRLRTTGDSFVKVAIKVITIEGTNVSSLSEKEVKAQRIVEEFGSLDHFNVSPLIWASIELGQLEMMFPWNEGGTLSSYVDDMHNRLTDVQRLTLIRDVATGLHYLHSNRIIHGCLSGGTVAIDAKGTALLTDYGLSTLVDDHGFPLFDNLGAMLGTVRWAALECLGGEIDGITRNIPTEKSDIYSFGSIMLQVFSGNVPYHYYEREEDVVSAVSRRETPKRPDDHRLTDDRWLFIQECWSASRPSSEDIVEFATCDVDLAPQKSHQDIDTRTGKFAAAGTLKHSTLDDHNPNMPTTDAIKPKGGKRRASMAREDVLSDDSKAIKLKPSDYRGYESRHAASHGLKRYPEAVRSFPTIRSQPIVDNTKYIGAKPAIRPIIEDTLRHMPRVVINTDSGRLFDRTQQIEAFQALPIYSELVSSMTRKLDSRRIETEVKNFYRYAMLSHRWEDGEPLHQEVKNISIYDLKPSPANVKLQKFCLRVHSLGFQWAWSDSSCIDRGSHAVLQVSLVAMFDWYRGSSLTIVFLRGVSSESQRPGDLAKSIWNTRAWTFQEYVASLNIQFYTEDWEPYLGLELFNHKESPVIIAEMEQATGVSAREMAVLRPGRDRVREKLYLASRRKATLVEDTAYSLLGIFDVDIRAIYGEGTNAVGRLLEEIITISRDVTVLAWTGKAGRYNSCLPEDLTVYNPLVPPHVPRPIERAKINDSIATLRSSLSDLSLAHTLRYHLNALPPPMMVGGLLRLPGIVFPVTNFVPDRESAPIPAHAGALSGPPTLAIHASNSALKNLCVYRATLPVFGNVEVKTTDNLTGKSLCLVHPWIHPLLDQEIAEGAHMLSKTTRASRIVARLRQPFGALLFEKVSLEEYRRVATDSLIMVQIREDVSLDELIRGIRRIYVL